MAETPTPEQSGAARWQARYDAAQAKGQVRDADFTTLSMMEVDPVYGPADGAEVPESIGWPGEFPSPAGSTPPATAVEPGRSASSPASATPSRPTSATR